MFGGWLIKFGNVTLPNSFLLADGWESTPNQRVEIDAYRDANVLLHRETSENYKTKITFSVREMNLSEKMAFQNVIGLATLSGAEKKERKVSVTYWNDEDNVYTSAVMYMPDIKYQIHTVDERKNDINYNSFKVTLIEY
ncbi:DUF6711 family protein [Kineothrix sp. MB12-C1]|uniref:DUF6711 family protein n=1 Tax=Kineothrix sp. MB12-C1 TaxID=3070215 RepID=UPI0027D310C4|nr:DUF6711 family protein [Kineothrix sp. MB12-C1]WMC91264.1 hypothetical protein RBB56_10245 [Kineothrix sp. MB12-C1]